MPPRPHGLAGPRLVRRVQRKPSRDVRYQDAEVHRMDDADRVDAPLRRAVRRTRVCVDGGHGQRSRGPAERRDRRIHGVHVASPDQRPTRRGAEVRAALEPGARRSAWEYVDPDRTARTVGAKGARSAIGAMGAMRNDGTARTHLTRRRFLEQLGAVGGSSLVMTAMNSWDL